ncbi:MAG: SCO family protein [Candidatus Zixiibacteriota bacterium]|nr:MAG: SCO family protein [candidate division Zixibacteria bacterium]
MKSIAHLITAILLIFPSAQAQLIQERVPQLEGVGVVEHLGGKIPLDLTFQNARGDTVRLAEYFRQGTPVVLSMHYTNCPMLCSLVLNGLANTVRDMDWRPGNRFEMVSVSFDPEETPQLASAVKDRYVASLGPEAGPDAWHFLVGPEEHSKALAEALGFQYKWVPERQEYAHPAVIFVLAGDGTISRYLYGIEFKEQDLRLALLEASEGKIGNTIDRIILYCFHYDPEAGSYVVLAGNVMKLGGLATLILLGVFLGVLWSRDKVRRAGREPVREPREETLQDR